MKLVSSEGMLSLVRAGRLSVALFFSVALSCASAQQQRSGQDQINKIPVAEAAREERDEGQALAGKVLELAVLGDAGDWNKNTESLRNSMRRLNVNKLVMPGDNLYRGSYEQAWEPWREVGFEFPVVAIGNHNNGYAKEVAYFQMPGEFYSRKFGTVARFIVVNSDNKKTIPEQVSWLRSELASATEEFVFLMFHHPSFTVSPHHTWEEKEKFQLEMHKIYREFRKQITAVIVGHDHFATAIEFDDIPVILSGAGQNIRKGRRYDNVQEGFRVKTAWLFDDKPYWAKMKLESDAKGMKTGTNEVELQFIRSEDDAVRCTIFLKTGLPMRLDKNCLETTM